MTFIASRAGAALTMTGRASLFKEMLKLVQPKPEAQYVLVHAEQGYTANVPLADLDRENVLLCHAS